MTNELQCSFDQFKRMSKEFIDSAATLNEDELDNAWKCLGLGYLNMDEEMWRSSAVILLNMMTRVYLQRKSELEMVA